MAEGKGLTDEQKEKIRKDFRDFSGGYHPGEAGDEREQFLSEWGDEYGEEELDAFLEEWGEEESQKESELFRKQREQREADFKKQMQRLASSLVSVDSPAKCAVLTMEDPSDPERKLVLRLAPRDSQVAAKADAADLMWAVQMLLERGVKERGGW